MALLKEGAGCSTLIREVWNLIQQNGRSLTIGEVVTDDVEFVRGFVR